jgi:hypothetical protein
VYLLALLVVACYVCELPAIAAAALHDHAGDHEADRHTHDHHPEGSQLSCDSVVGIQRAPDSFPEHGPDLHVGTAPAVVGIAARVVADPLSIPSAVPKRRPPLFLLHSSFLI